MDVTFAGSARDRLGEGGGHLAARGRRSRLFCTHASCE